METVHTAKPPIKWVGSKRQLLPELLKYVPEAFGMYFEPFLGGGALFFALQPKEAVLSDTNRKLITMYTALRCMPEKVIQTLESGGYKNDEETYYRVRAHNMSRGDAPQLAADFLYLNRYGYNGLYRENQQGGYNVPFGDNPNARIDYDNLRKASKVLAGNVQLSVAPFTHVLELAEAGDFVYFDPPYIPVSETSDFTKYQGVGFELEDHIRLRDVAYALHQRGVHVLLSNSSAPEVYELYKDFRIVEVNARRSVNSNAEKRGVVKEVLIRPPSRFAYAFI